MGIVEHGVYPHARLAPATLENQCVISCRVWTTLQRTTLSGFVDPMQNQYMLGPMQWNMSASAFKTVKITERAFLRINVDFLNNVFNMPGTPNPNGTSGLISTQGSANSPRTLQLTGRITF